MNIHTTTRIALFGLLTFALSSCHLARIGPTGPEGRAAQIAESSSPASQANPKPPVATRRPHKLTTHGHTRIDPYYWLRQRDNPEVIDYLKAENAYTQAMMADTEALQEKLFHEIKGRIQQDDNSVPVRIDDYYYSVRYETGSNYPIHVRRHGSLLAPEEILIDENARAKGHAFYLLAGFTPAPNHRIVAFAEDLRGRRIYTIRFKDLSSGELLADTIEGTSGDLAWANDSRTVFYVRREPQTLRMYQVYRHRLGSDPSRDVLVYEEPDEEYRVFLWKTKSDRYLMIGSFQTLSTEIRYLDADDPTGDWNVFVPRRPDHKYGVGQHGDWFYIRTNRGGAENFQLMRTPVANTAESAWQVVIPHREDVLLEDVELFRDYLVVTERKQGLEQLRVRRLSSGEEYYLRFDEPAYLVYLSDNAEMDTGTLRYVYQSMTTPASTYDFDMATRERELLKREKVLGGFDTADYVTERLWTPARDGVRVPVSLVHRRDTPIDGTAPLLVYGYGSYGASEDAGFNSSLLSLLDRDWVFAIAHVRGGQELGRSWYLDGKLLNKKNTFRDFIDVTEFLVREGYGNPERVFAVGGSAGGLLMGAIANMRPDLYAGIIAAVPFVDVLTTMLDPSIPLTTFEYDEWGNPNDPEYYKYILSYSPYDNVTAQDYPNLLVITSLQDSQVQYWEPAKWVAKLRAMKTGEHVVLLKTDLHAGHGGASARDKRYRERALEYAFLLEMAQPPGGHRQARTVPSLSESKAGNP